MCGIHGFVNGDKAEVNSDDYVKSGCVAGMLRGVDSTGVAVIKTLAKEVKLRKLPVPGLFFIEDKLFRKMLPDMRSPNAITIAHTRAATVGDVKIDTAHPFQYTSKTSNRRMVGVHNGTLTGWMAKPGARDFEVDSDWALNLIFEKGLDAFKEFTGAYCFVWWDSDHPTKLFMARNSQRTMHVAFTDKGGMAFASEAGMVAWLADRHNINVKGDIKELREDALYTFDMDDLANVKTERLPAPVYSTYNSSTSYSSSYVHVSTTKKVDDWLSAVMEKEKEKKQEENKQVPLVAVESTGKDRRLVVTKEEVEDAKSLDILHDKVTFRPGHTDNRSDILYGEVTLMDSTSGHEWQCDAIMRNASNVQWSPEDEFEVTVLGAFLSASDAVIIVSKPRVKLKAVGTTAEDADTAVAH